MNVNELLGWIDPYDEYKLQTPTCVLDDFVCWEFDEVNTVHLHMPAHETFRLAVFAGGELDTVVESGDTMYILNRCRDFIAEQQYKGVWYV